MIIKKIAKQMSLLIIGAFLTVPAGLMAEGSHEQGLFVRSLLVAGQLDYKSENEEFSELEGEGSGSPAFEAAFSVGRVVIPNLAVHGGLDFAVIGSVKEDDDSETPISNYTHLSLGLSYYIMPANIYIGLDLRSLLFGFKSKNVDDEGRVTFESTQKSDGLGYRFIVGKEWFMSSNYGLGVALSYSHTPAKTDFEITNYPSSGCVDCTTTKTSTTTKTKANILGIAFSTTFN